MNTVGRILWAAFAVVTGGTAAMAESLPPSEQVLTTLRRVNDRFLLNWPEPGRDIVTDRARPSNIWTRATYFEGLMALHAIEPDARYYDYAVRWGQSHNWQPAYGTADPRHADNQCCGQTYLDLYALDPRPERLAGIKAALDLMVDGTKSDDWWWIDALQMSMPVFTRLGVQLGDTRYFEKMHALYTHTKRAQGGRGLYNSGEHLWWRDADFDPPYLEPNGANCYWSRGNGWVFAGLARVLDRLPVSDPHRAEYLRDFQDMAAALAPLQRSDGFWNVSLKDPGNYGGRELTGTAFFTYGMAWGIRRGHLSRSIYLPVVARAWRALANLAVRPDGTLGYVQGSGKQPSDGQPVTYDSIPNFDDFGTGAFLLAGSEVHLLAAVRVIDAISGSKWIEYRQLDASNTVLAEGSPFHIEIRIRGTGLSSQSNSSSSPSVIIPGGTAQPLVFNGHTAELEWTRRASSAALLDMAFPDGSYIASETSSSLLLNWTNAAIEIPQVTTTSAGTWTAGSFTVNAGQELSLTTNGPPHGGLATISIEGADLHQSSSIYDPPDRRGATLTIAPYTLTPSRSYTVRIDFTAAPMGVLQPLASGDWVIVEPARNRTTTFDIVVAPPTHSREKLVNVSSQGFASMEHPLIAGFVVSSGGPKMVLVRAVGPGLQVFGIANVLSNPYLRVLNEKQTRAWQNDDWQSSSQYLALTTAGATALQAGYSNPRDAAASARESGAFPLIARSRDAALVLVLPPGNYTAQVTPAGSTTPGQALVEVYELATTQTNPRLTNLSARGTVSPVDALTTGFVITGGSKRVLLRGIGPALANVGVPGAATLRDPAITVFDSTGGAVAQNDNWNEAANLAELNTFRAAVGAFPLATGGRDAELALTLPPGAYTLRVTSADGGAGMALAEIYTEPPGS